MTIDMLTTQLAALGWLDWALLVFVSLPPLFVLYSRRVAGGKKLLWFVLTSLLSWLAYVPFLFLTRGVAKSDDAPSGKA